MMPWQRDGSEMAARPKAAVHDVGSEIYYWGLGPRRDGSEMAGGIWQNCPFEASAPTNFAMADPSATHGYPRLPTASHGYPRLPTATHGWARLGWAGLGWV
jgi:hypothetical protein